MEDTVFTIDINSIQKKAKSNLSAMGKRLVGKDGKTLFASTTLSSAEESLLNSYIQKGIEIFLGEISPIIIGYTDGDTVVLSIRTNRLNEGKVQAFRENFSSFVVEYAIQKVLGLSLTEEARRNAEEDLQRHLSSSIKLVFQKDAPTVTHQSLSGMTGEVIID